MAALNAKRRTNPSRYVYDLDVEEGKRGVDRQIQIVFGLDEGAREADFKMVRGGITDLPELQPCFWAHTVQQIYSNPSGVCVPRSR